MDVERATAAVAATSAIVIHDDDDDDDFGSGDFLDNFDVDAAVQDGRSNRAAAKNPYAGARESPRGKRARVTELRDATEDVQPKLVAGTPITVGSKVEMSDYDISDNVLMSLNMPLATTSVGLSESNDDDDAADVDFSEHDAPDPKLDAALLETLGLYFGHSSFREGQLDCIRTLVRSCNSQKRRDVAVFWSTGSGKSICYQVPPLHLGKIAIVVSPLISLMEDQVSKLNGLLDQEQSDGTKDLAVFLGSAQADAAADEKALRGDYHLVYLTPEKLLSQGFLDALGRLHKRSDLGSDNICLIAIDESHCVSEWGHDFRPEYRKMGSFLRTHPIMSRVPMVALTATAVPRVQKDIVGTLGMTNVRMLRQTFDRSNLAIQVYRKPKSGGFRTALQGLVHEIKASLQEEGLGRQSTIIYAVTRDQVDELSEWLASQFQTETDDDDEEKDGLTVQAYHAGLSAKKRTEVHTNFLIGRTPIIVATIAFGMGIDKPDTRRVIHYGPPQTVEAYYQQIGRAGRDGMPATVTMFCNDSDFARYKDDFYLGGLSAEARLAVERSTDALRDYAMDEEACRRASLLRFFEEVPSFGARCGTCDACLNQLKYADDAVRDFASKGARVLLRAVAATNGQQGMTVIEKVVGGKLVEDYRYGAGQRPAAVQADIALEKERMERKVPLSYYRELLPSLVNRGFIEKGERKSSPKGVYYATTWTTYELTALGQSVLAENKPVLLPVPQALREMERAEEEKRLKTLASLRESGIKVDQISEEDLERHDVLSALSRWNSYLEGRKRAGKDVAPLEDLVARLEKWRADMAVRYRMAPVNVAAEHLMVQMAYMVATLKPNSRIDREALLATGLRSGGVDDLVATLQEWAAAAAKEEQSPAAASSSFASGARMTFSDEPFQPAAPWKHAIYKPNKKTGVAAWEGSYHRFVDKGEHPQTIAVSQPSGRPIQMTTVLNHIWEGLLHGRPVPLGRLAALDGNCFPNEAEWRALKRAEDEMKMDAEGNPTTSGYQGGVFRIADLLRPILGDEFADKQAHERTEEEWKQYGSWCERTRPYLALRRVGYQPQFEDSAETSDGPKT